MVNNMQKAFQYLKHKKVLMLFFSFVTTLFFSQEKPIIDIKDNLFEAGFFYEISLSDDAALQNGLVIRKNTDSNTFEIPVALRIDHTKQLSTFISFQTRSLLQTSQDDFFNSIERPSNSYFSIGMDHEFKNGSIGNITFNFPFRLDLGLKF